MKKNISVPINENISKVIQLLHLNQLGIVAIVNSKNKVLGTITDGDLRREMFDKNIENLSVRKIMNKKPILGNQKLSKQEKINIIIDNKIYQLPVIDTQKKLIEITTLKNILTYILHTNLLFSADNLIVQFNFRGKTPMSVTRYDLRFSQFYFKSKKDGSIFRN